MKHFLFSVAVEQNRVTEKIIFVDDSTAATQVIVLRKNDIHALARFFNEATKLRGGVIHLPLD